MVVKRKKSGDGFYDFPEIKEPTVIQMHPPAKHIIIFSPRKLTAQELRRKSRDAGIVELGSRGIIVTEAAIPIPRPRTRITVEYTYLGHIFFPPSLACFHVFRCRIILGIVQSNFFALQ